jgi:multiple sugar transport system ATP-binding protein
VFQNYALYPHFKVRGNIAFYFRLRRGSAAAIDDKVQETARIMGLGFDKLLGRMPRSLSGGERQRVALARCLSRNPRVLLLDEPFSNLDAALRLQTRSEVKKLVDRFELTTVFVTHDQSEAVAIGHRIAVMQAGQIEQVGSYHELYHQPANVFVAGFLGSPPMNFFPAQRHNDTMSLRVEDVSLSLPLPAWLRSRLAPDEPLTVGLRPEHLRLAAPHVPDGFAGSADMVEVSMSDASQVVHLRRGQRTFLVKTALQQSIQPHETLWMQLPTESMYFFDRHGKRF